MKNYYPKRISVFGKPGMHHIVLIQEEKVVPYNYCVIEFLLSFAYLVDSCSKSRFSKVLLNFADELLIASL